jgi:hypothetical protein
VHWSFFRDAHQCATSGVDYFILDNAPRDGDLGNGDEEAISPPSGAGGEPPPGPRRLERNLVDGPRRTVSGRRAVAAPEPSPGRGHRHAGGEGEEEEVGGEEAAGQAASAGAERAAVSAARPDEGAAAVVAREWFSGFARGDVGAMTRRARFPFRSAAGVAARTTDELARMLGGLVAESPHRSVGPVAIETMAGLRKLLGKLPPGLDDGSGMLFGVAQVDGDALILLLAATPEGWRVAGLIRR